MTGYHFSSITEKMTYHNISLFIINHNMLHDPSQSLNYIWPSTTINLHNKYPTVSRRTFHQLLTLYKVNIVLPSGVVLHDISNKVINHQIVRYLLRSYLPFQHIATWEVWWYFNCVICNIPWLLISQPFPVKFPKGEFQRTSLMISQHWISQWLGAIRQQAITRTNVD